MGMTFVSIMWLVATAPTPNRDRQFYLTQAIKAYEAGQLVHHRSLPPPDTWALAAALIAKHSGNHTFSKRAVLGLEAFTADWVNVTDNGTKGYPRSGFTGWLVVIVFFLSPRGPNICRTSCPGR